MSSIPNPATTSWVPVGPGPMPDFRYRGDFVAATNYYDGDIVVYNGVGYLCVAPTSAAPTPWATPPGALPQPVVNGQWVKGVGGAAVWAPITPTDVIGLANYSATSANISGANTDLAWPGGSALSTLITPSVGGGSLRNLGAPGFGAGARVIIQSNAASTFQILHNTSGTGPRFFLRTNTNITLRYMGTAEFVYDGAWWEEVSRGTYTTYGTTLPTNPVDGEEAILVDNVGNPTYQWYFRYNAGSSSAYKWEFIGGNPRRQQAYVNAALNTLTGAPSGLWTHSSINFTVPRAGDWAMTGHVMVGMSTGTLNVYGYSGGGLISGAALAAAQSQVSALVSPPVNVAVGAVPSGTTFGACLAPPASGDTLIWGNTAVVPQRVA